MGYPIHFFDIRIIGRIIGFLYI